MQSQVLPYIFSILPVGFPLLCFVRQICQRQILSFFCFLRSFCFYFPIFEAQFCWILNSQLSLSSTLDISSYCLPVSVVFEEKSVVTLIEDSLYMMDISSPASLQILSLSFESLTVIMCRCGSSCVYPTGVFEFWRICGLMVFFKSNFGNFLSLSLQIIFLTFSSILRFP